ncbi:MAG: DoxX family protein [Chitinophagaceae bacterium]
MFYLYDCSFSFRLIYGVIDNILHWEKMLEFEQFLNQFKFPLPLISAVVSVYAQFIAGILILIGWKIRWAAFVMIINLLVALVMVHRNDTVEQMTRALAILFCCVLFLFYGSGRYSLDKRIKYILIFFIPEPEKHDS